MKKHLDLSFSYVHMYTSGLLRIHIYIYTRSSVDPDGILMGKRTKEPGGRDVQERSSLTIFNKLRRAIVDRKQDASRTVFSFLPFKIPLQRGYSYHQPATKYLSYLLRVNKPRINKFHVCSRTRGTNIVAALITFAVLLIDIAAIFDA